MKIKNIFSLVALLLLGHYIGYSQVPSLFQVKMASPSDVLYQRELVDTGSNKSDTLAKRNDGVRQPIFAGAIAAEPTIVLNSLLDDVRFIALDILDNPSIGVPGASTYTITTNIPSSWGLEIRRQAMITDWYVTANPTVPNIDYYGDALPKLAPSGNSWTLKIRNGDLARLNLSFKVVAGTPPISNIEITVNNSNQQIVKNIPITVYNKPFPDEPFNSIMYYNDGTLPYPEIMNMADRYGLTHFVVPTPPNCLYEDNGDLHSFVSAAGFDDQTYNWVNNPNLGDVVFFWSFNPQKQSGGYLAPYTNAWMNAYVQTVKKAAELMTAFSGNPNYTPKIVLYVADEIGSGTSHYDVSDVVKVRDFLIYLQQYLPEYRTLVTFGYNSSDLVIDLIKPVTDILVPHFIMPTTTVGGGFPNDVPNGYNPAAVFRDKFYDKTPPQSSWAYMVESGKNANIKDFRLLPTMAAFNGFEGMSWWAFSHHHGSTWIGNDGGLLDYSTCYAKEANPVYDYWTDGIDQTEGSIPSARLLAGGAGIQDAKLLKFLLKNETYITDIAILNDLTNIKQLLGSVNDPVLLQPQPTTYLDFNTIEDISRRLRKIYASVIVPPTTLNCTHLVAGKKLSWNPVPGAAGYKLIIYNRDPSCCSTNNPYSFITVWDVTGTDTLIPTAFSSCFSWYVNTVSLDGTISAASTKKCSCPAVLPGLKGTNTPLLSEEITISAVPNPASEYIDFSIRIKDPNVSTDNLVLYLYDIVGREIIKTPVKNKDYIRLNVQSYRPGMYIYEFRNENGTIHRDKILVQRN